MIVLKHSSLYVRRIAVSAICLSVALVLSTFTSFYIPVLGQNGMRIGISGVFVILPSLLFGPVYGAIVSGLSDLLGWVLRPTGPYLPMMTLVMALGGFIRGAIWMGLRNRGSRGMRVAVTLCAAALLVFGLCNIAFLTEDGVTYSFYDSVNIHQIQTEDMHAISRMLITRTMNTSDPGKNLATYLVTMTWGLVGSAIFGLSVLLADLLISKFLLKDETKGKFLHILISMLVSGLIVTTLNTIVLREFLYESWKLLPFTVVWIPRVIEEIISNMVKAYFVALFMGLFSRPSLQNIAA